ncbi:alpha/beta fold hydrolase [Streptomyces sp. NPDC054904]|uniref:alpha/beta fold hydrolase n=1 Tax=Streptomyces sp. NPDC090054 TaxID=3365933 RepID=UPI00380DF93E
MTEPRTVTVNEVPLGYEVSGPTDGDPLLLLRALGESAADWGPVRDALARKRRVYALDLRGHGRSGWTQDHSLELMRDDVLGFLDALGLDAVDLVGHSTGGAVAVLVAREQPWRVIRLVLEDVPDLRPREPVAPVRPTGELALDRTRVPAGRAGSDRPDPARFEALERITAPTLVVAGGPTSHVPRQGLAELVRRVPDARLQTIAVGHLVHATAPDAFTDAVTTFLDDLPDAELARRWLAREGVRRTGENEWTDGGSEGGRLTSDDVAHTWAEDMVLADDLDDAGRTRLGFGLVDLLDAYWVTVELGFALPRTDDPQAAARILWEGYRSRLEAPVTAKAITYSLWVDWFENHTTSEAAFAEVLGNDHARLLPDAPQPLLRRARRVLESSGPVPWSAKAVTYRAAARVPALHHALFRALLLCYHDVYGALDPAEGLALLDGLELPPDTEHVAALRTVLAAGLPNRRERPEAWDAAVLAAGDAAPE